jgi:hypothetical protein
MQCIPGYLSIQQSEVTCHGSTVRQYRDRLDCVQALQSQIGKAMEPDPKTLLGERAPERGITRKPIPNSTKPILLNLPLSSMQLRQVKANPSSRKTNLLLLIHAHARVIPL